MTSVLAFLTRHGMEPERMSDAELTAAYRSAMELGLAGGESSVPMLTSYIYADTTPALNTPTVVIDAGGTNFRRALVTFTKKGTVIQELEQSSMPGTHEEATWEEFISCCADAVEPLLDRARHIGVCFSYSFTPTPDRDGRVIKITKQVRISGAEDRPICGDLKAELERRGHYGLSFCLLNDTLAVQLGVAAAERIAPKDCMGLVCGTGSNVCCAVHTDQITKLTNVLKGYMLINTESGFFHDVLQGDYDKMLDDQSLDPGHARSEKMVSGAYLGELCRLTLKGAAADDLFSDEGKTIMEGLEVLTSNEADTMSGPLAALNEADAAIADAIIDAIFDRSAKIICCTLSTVMELTDAGRDKPFHIGAEGSLFQKSRRFRPHLDRRMNDWAANTLGRQYDFLTCQNTTLIGTACAALL